MNDWIPYILFGLWAFLTIAGYLVHRSTPVTIAVTGGWPHFVKGDIVRLGTGEVMRVTLATDTTLMVETAAPMYSLRTGIRPDPPPGSCASVNWTIEDALRNWKDTVIPLPSRTLIGTKNLTGEHIYRLYSKGFIPTPFPFRSMDADTFIMPKKILERLLIELEVTCGL